MSKRMRSTVTILVTLLSLALAEESLRYVQPNISSSSPDECPGQPCLTLDQYIQESSKYFTTASTFLFLPGNHSLTASLNMTALSNISFIAKENSTATITCSETVAVDDVTGLHIEGLTFVLHLAQQEGIRLSAFSLVNSTAVIINTVFVRGNNGSQDDYVALNSTQSRVFIADCLFEGHMAYDGAAITAQIGTVLTLTGNTFTRNEATSRYGGAIYGLNSKLSLRGNNFTHNLGRDGGGALYCSNCSMTLTHSNNFYNNSVSVGIGEVGGAIAMSGGRITVTGYANFSHNKAKRGGAMSLSYVRAEFGKGKILFEKNIAEQRGGAINIEFSPFVFEEDDYSPFSTADDLDFIFIGNVAKDTGNDDCGALCIFNTKSETKCNISATLLSNVGTSGGALFIEKTYSFTLYNIHAENNSDGALGILFSTAKIVGTNLFLRNANKRSGVVTISIECDACSIYITGNNTFDNNNAFLGAISINNSHVEFSGNTTIINNVGMLNGGGIYSRESTVLFDGYTLFRNNSGNLGGGMFIDRGEIYFRTRTSFEANLAGRFGGGLFASSATIHMYDTITFSLNSAQSGGAIYVSSETTIVLDNTTQLTTMRNMADYGAAIYHIDSIRDIQCSNISRALSDRSLALAVPLSFLQITSMACPRIRSFNDSADKDGCFLYGGLLDRTRLQAIPHTTPYDYFTSVCNVSILSPDDQANGISSEPYQLKFCDNDFVLSIEVYKGQTFSFPIVALGQGNSEVPATLRASFSSTARLKLDQSSQRVTGECSNVTYNFYSTQNVEQLTLYPKGPCGTIGEASTVINVTFLPCPDAFNQSREECVCEDRLERLNATCMIDDEVVIMRFAGARFWMNASYHENGSYNGLILSSTCPEEYCVTDTVGISLDNPDVQCAFHRSGVLCGQCATNFSLILGGSRCQICSNINLLLILPFAVAGIALVIFLSITRLTVSTGTINSLILYANIVQVNKRVFFPSNRANILTIFIAWINLDLGFETCFFDGMDIFAQTCLQFAFSVYVWTLILVIILSSRHSILVSKLIGSNPVAVLATLLLMSYNKILKVIIDVFSSINLEYPGERKVSVWLRDGNLPFLQSKHLVLSLLTLLVLVLVFVPYTIFLLLGPLLYRLPDEKWYDWLIMKIKPLLDSYYAPYKLRTQYWTGFLLLVRCVLYIVFSFNSLEWTNYSLLAIIITFSAVGIITWIHKGIYQYYYIDVIELSVYLNLVILSASAATLPDANKVIVTYILVGAVFATSMGITMYQIHFYYFSKTALWLKIRSKILLHWKGPADDDALIQNIPERNEAVLNSTTGLRESLLG